MLMHTIRMQTRSVCFISLIMCICFASQVPFPKFSHAHCKYVYMYVHVPRTKGKRAHACMTLYVFNPC